MFDLNVDIKGLDEIGSAMANLESSLQKTVGVNALRAGAKIIRDEARRLVPSQEGHLRENIVYAAKKNEIGVSVYVRKEDKGGSPNNAFYAHFVEFGSGIFREGGGGRTDAWKYTPKGGNAEWHGGKFFTTVGHPPQPFMRPALDSKKSDALNAAMDKLRKFFDTGQESE